MDNDRENLEGSPSRDYFKRLHKQQLGGGFFALDSDLELVEKYPRPGGIVARLDLKMRGDRITFVEAVAYNEYIKKLAPIYIVQSPLTSKQFLECDPSQHRFDIFLFKSADPKPYPIPTVVMEQVAFGVTWEGFKHWEVELRKKWKMNQPCPMLTQER